MTDEVRERSEGGGQSEDVQNTSGGRWLLRAVTSEATRSSAGRGEGGAASCFKRITLRHQSLVTGLGSKSKPP